MFTFINNTLPSLFALAGFAMVVFLILDDKKAFIHPCRHCGKPLPRFHKGYCCVACMVYDRMPDNQTMKTITSTPDAIRLMHSMQLFDTPGPARIYPIRCTRKKKETIKFIAAKSAAQAYYRFFSRYPGFTPVPEDPKPC